MSDRFNRVLAADPAVVIVGESISVENRGSPSHFETPIAERGTLGFALGLAMAGKKPVVEISSTQRLFAALELLEEAAAIARAGDFPATLVIRVASGTEAGRIDRPILDVLTAIDGLNVAIARDAAMGEGLLIAAIAAPGPTVLLEPRVVMQGRAPKSVAAVAFGAAMLREGHHATILGFGSGVAEALCAAEGLAAQGIEVDVIDLVSAAPLDVATVARRVRATGRLIVADGGEPAFARQLTQVVLDHAFEYLEAPPAIAADAPGLIAAVHAAIQF